MEGNIIIRLKGESSNWVKIRKSINVKTKLRCEICGKKNKSSSKFCSACGTFLE